MGRDYNRKFSEFALVFGFNSWFNFYGSGLILSQPDRLFRAQRLSALWFILQSIGTVQFARAGAGAIEARISSMVL